MCSFIFNSRNTFIALVLVSFFCHAERNCFLKKSSGILRKGNRLVVYRFIDDNKNIFGLRWLCNKSVWTSFFCVLVVLNTLQEIGSFFNRNPNFWVYTNYYKLYLINTFFISLPTINNINFSQHRYPNACNLFL